MVRLTLLILIAISQLLTLPQSHADSAAVEAQLVRIEFYDTSNEYALVFKRCSICSQQIKRFANDARINLNNGPSTLNHIYSHRNTLKTNVDFAYSKSNNRIVWINVMAEESL